MPQSENNYTRKTACRCCGEKKLRKYLPLGKQPLANTYHTGEILPAYPLEVMLCKACFHSQLSVVVNPDSMFKNYLYVSGTTQTFRNHCKKLAEDAVRRFTKKKLAVLDIACNDGTQLKFFRDLTCEVYGVDPAKNLRKITVKKDIPVIVDYWTPKAAKKLKKKFDIITGTNVFAHVDNLDEFLEATKMVLDPDGLLILEFPYANKMVTYNEFDTVYHEHLSYFLVHSFKALMERLGFYIVDILQTPIHGGSIRFFVRMGKKNHSKKVAVLIAQEKKAGLLTEKAYTQFAKRVKKNKKNMQELFRKLKKQKKKIVGYGASAKGNTMLNYFKINLSYIVDDNELKWGYKTPGRNIPIFSPATLSKEQEELAVIVLSWNFYNEIAKKITMLRNKKYKDRLITYVPTIEMNLLKDALKNAISA